MSGYPVEWKLLTDEQERVIYHQREDGGYRVQPLYSNRWHACLRLEPDGTWIEFAGKESLADAMRKCRQDLDQQIANNTAA